MVLVPLTSSKWCSGPAEAAGSLMTLDCTPEHPWQVRPQRRCSQTAVSGGGGEKRGISYFKRNGRKLHSYLQLSLHLKVVVAVLQVWAERRQQLDTVGSNIIGAPLLQMGEAQALIGPSLHKTICHWGWGHISMHISFIQLTKYHSKRLCRKYTFIRPSFYLPEIKKLRNDEIITDVFHKFSDLITVGL